MSSTAKIGFSWVIADSIELAHGAKIGHFNFIRVNKMRLATGACIGHVNRIMGRLYLRLNRSAAIGNFNIIVKASSAVKNTNATLYLGCLSKITSRHYIDCLNDVRIGSFSTVAGCGSQLWTHGYYHFPERHERVRVDGEIKIGRYCYIGSHCVINPGVRITDSVNVGSHCCISKSITEPGFYVNPPLRRLENRENFDGRFEKGDEDLSVEPFYVKKP